MSDRRSRDWSEARAAVEEGHESFREVAERLGVSHSAVSRAARREAWVLPPHRPGLSAWEGLEEEAAAAPVTISGATGAVEGDDSTQASPGPQIDAERPIGERERAVMAPGPAPQEVWGPPDDERSAKLWVCPRCKRVGYDVNRREPWHTPESCDRRMAHLDDALDDRPRRAVDLMRVRF